MLSRLICRTYVNHIYVVGTMHVISQNIKARNLQRVIAHGPEGRGDVDHA